MDSGLTQQVINVFPEEYRPLIATLSAIAISIFGLVMFLLPFILKWSANKQTAAINDNALSAEDISKAVETSVQTNLAIAEKGRLTGELGSWKYKLIFATDETRPLIESEILRLENELTQYA